jgi:hypothetical protein
MRVNWYFRLEGHEPVQCADVLEWGKWFETADRHVKQEMIGDIRVSTVFLGLDHSFGDDGPPILFETMIFGGTHNEYQDRCATWDEAVAMHERAVALVKGAS